jgi:hypothetical protein
VPPDFSLECDVIRPNPRGLSDLSFVTREFRKHAWPNVVTPHYPVAPDEGIACQGGTSHTGSHLLLSGQLSLGEGIEGKQFRY